MYKVKCLATIFFFWILLPAAHAESSPEAAGLPLSKPMEIKKKMEEIVLIDPTKPVEISGPNKQFQSKPKIKFLNVQIISYKPDGGSFVVINGKRFMEGDVFEKTTIKKIEKNKVILSNPERKPLVLEYANLSIKAGEGSQP